jgi:hypothetical protein
MARKDTQSALGGRLHRAADAIKRIFTRGGEAETQLRSSGKVEKVSLEREEPSSTPRMARATTRRTDIPMDALDRAYTPPVTSSKASFRSDGADHGSDQEYAYGVADDRWNDEDRLTNKSGDPRIGTHRRTYEPGESRDESRD